MLAIVAILIAIWFYKSAINAQNHNIWAWVATGVVSYYVAGALWVYAFLPLIMGRQMQSPSISTGIAIEISGILAGLLVVTLIRIKFLRRNSGRKSKIDGVGHC